LGITRDLQELLELPEDDGIPGLEDFQRERSLFEAIMQILFFRHVESVLCGFIGGLLTAYFLMVSGRFQPV
jgi:hypothetical protein